MWRSVALRSGRRLLRQRPAGSFRTLGISRHVDRWREPEEPKPEVDNVELGPDDMDFFAQDPNFAAGFSSLHDKQEDDEDEVLEKEKQKIRDELDAKTGRGWTDPWEITEEDWASPTTFEDLPDWSPSNASRLSVERVKTFDGKTTAS